MIRHMLHKNKLQEFITWCKDNGIKYELTGYQFEVLRILTDTKPIIFYEKMEPTEHVSVPTAGMGYVNKFLRERKKNGKKND